MQGDRRDPVEITRPMLSWFLFMISRLETDGLEKTVLDCGAGGGTPPLAQFAERGYTCHGIDISEERLQMAAAYAEKNGFDMDLRVGDMRNLPYADETFAFVYELESMCHLTKKETWQTLEEMNRVLVPGGYLFAHFMTTDFWPLTGREQAPGEFVETEAGQTVVHSYFEDDEVMGAFSHMRIVWKQKRYTQFPFRIEGITEAQWQSWYTPGSTRFTEAEWQALYAERHRCCYTAWEIIAQKPGN